MADGRFLSGQAQAFNEQQRRRAMELKFKELEERLTTRFSGQIAELERKVQLVQAQLDQLLAASETTATAPYRKR